MPGDLKDVNVAAYSGTTNARYLFGTSNIVDHARTIVENCVIFCLGQFYSLFKHVESVISFKVPNAVFTFEQLSDLQKASLRSLGLTEDPTAKNTFNGTPSASDLNTVYSMGPIDSRFSPGSVSADGYLAYIYGLKGLAIFSQLSRGYMGEKMNLFAKMESTDTSEGGEWKVARDNVTSTEVDCKLGALQGFNQLTSSTFMEFVYPGTSSKRILGAFMRPSSIDSWGVDDSILFPYFNSMITPNKEIMADIFIDLFFKGLSDSADGAARMASKLRTGFRRLATTRAGLAMTHAYHGIRLAIQSQNAISFLIESGVYFGYILTGPENVVFYGQVQEKLDAEALKKEVGRFNRRDRVLGEMLSLMNSPLNASGMPVYKFTKTDIDTSRRFSNAYATISEEYLGAKAFTEDLPKFVDEMLWGDNFSTPSQSMILDFLRYVHTGEDHYIEKYPAYLSGSYYRKTSRVARGLGIFGGRAPSCSYGTTKDQTFTIPKDLEAEDPNMKETDGKRLIAYLPFSIVPITTAFNQWNALFQSGMMRIPHGRKDKTEFTNGKQVHLQIGGNPAFSTAYHLIKEHSAVVRKAAQEGKRRRVDDDSEAGPSGSRKRAKKESVLMAADI